MVGVALEHDRVFAAADREVVTLAQDERRVHAVGDESVIQKALLC